MVSLILQTLSTSALDITICAPCRMGGACPAHRISAVCDVIESLGLPDVLCLQVKFRSYSSDLSRCLMLGGVTPVACIDCICGQS